MSDEEDINTKTKPNKPTALDVAKAILKSGDPLIQINGEVKRLTKAERTWVDWTNTVKRQISILTGGSPRTVMEVLEGFIGAPRPSEYRCTPYYQWISDDSEGDTALLNSHWEPYSLDPDAIAFVDGEYNLKTNEFVPWHKRGLYLYGPLVMLEYEKARIAAPTSKFEEFLASLELALPDPAARRYFQQTVAEILRPHVNQKSGIFLVGPSGCRKTTLATAIAMAPGGIGGFSFETIDELARSKFAQYNLLNKWVNVSDDAPGEHVNWTHWFKRYTGSSVMSVEAKYVQARNYPTTAKLIICCNRMPSMADESDAVMTRLAVFNLKRHGKLDDMFKAGLGDSGYLSTEYWNDENTRACIVAWMIEGLRLSLAHGRTPPEIVINWNKQATVESDLVRNILSENYEAADTFTSSAEILALLKTEGCACNGNTLSRYMRVLFELPTIRRRNDGVVYRGYMVKRKDEDARE
jgi:phage/plasmid-associated DNA primase